MFRIYKKLLFFSIMLMLTAGAGFNYYVCDSYLTEGIDVPNEVFATKSPAYWTAYGMKAIGLNKNSYGKLIDYAKEDIKAKMNFEEIIEAWENSDDELYFAEYLEAKHNEI